MKENITTAQHEALGDCYKAIALMIQSIACDFDKLPDIGAELEAYIQERTKILNEGCTNYQDALYELDHLKNKIKDLQGGN